MKTNQSGAKKEVTEADIYAGRAIACLRKVLGMSQSDLGKKIGVSFQQIQKYEAGTNRITAGTIQAISDALKIDISYFFKQSKKPNPQDLNLFTQKNAEALRSLSAFRKIFARAGL